MIYLCLRNFKCNNVVGHKGKQLSKEEVKDIKEHESFLLKNELIQVIEEQKPKSKDEKKPEASKKASKVEKKAE